MKIILTIKKIHTHALGSKRVGVVCEGQRRGKTGESQFRPRERIPAESDNGFFAKDKGDVRTFQGKLKVHLDRLVSLEGILEGSSLGHLGVAKAMIMMHCGWAGGVHCGC